MPVVLGPGVTGILLHEAIGHGMEADFNRKSISTYSTLIGKRVAEPFVTIVDDATNPALADALSVDDEGTPGCRTVLVENGILIGYRTTASRRRTTGPRRRAAAAVGATSTTRCRGSGTPACCRAPATPRGSHHREREARHLRAGRLERAGEDRRGDFAFYVSQGRLIEDGRLTAPIEDTNIMGNGPKMLQGVAMVANDLEMSQGAAGQCG